MSEDTQEAHKVHDAAEVHPDEAEKTNPVGEATEGVKQDHHDPYAMGNHIDNPEPNNGNGDRDDDKDPTERDEADVESEERNAQLLRDQEERNAKANTPDANLPDEDKTNKPKESEKSDKSEKEAKK